MSSETKQDATPRTKPAAKTLMIAIALATAAHQRAMQELAQAAVADDPELANASLDASTGVWTIPTPAQGGV